MAKKGKAYLRHLPTIYPDTVRPPPVLPEAESVLKMGLSLTEQELKVVRMAMAIHTTSRQPKLTWRGWQHIAVALAIGSEHAKKASKGRMDTPDYRRVMTDFLRSTGLNFLNHNDRACAVRLLDDWEEIDAWRSSLPPHRQQGLNNPREVEAAYFEDRKRLGDPDAKKRPSGRKHRQFPSMLEQMEALAEQIEDLQERLEQTEQQRDYFSEMLEAATDEAGMSEDAVAALRARVRANREAEREE